MKHKPFALVLMPFDEKFDAVYQHGVKGVCADLGIVCERVDEQNFEDHIVEQIYSQIRRADIVIAELTGSNPMCFMSLASPGL